MTPDDRSGDAGEPVQTSRNSPWMNSAEIAAYLKRSKHFVLREARAGRLKHARIGGHREVYGRREWCDEWVEDQTKPLLLPIRRRR